MMDRIVEKKGHMTAQEIDFIRDIGTFSSIGRKTSKQNLLRGYIQGCKKRNRWGQLDKAIVIKFAEDELLKSL